MPGGAAIGGAAPPHGPAASPAARLAAPAAASVRRAVCAPTEVLHAWEGGSSYREGAALQPSKGEGGFVCLNVTRARGTGGQGRGARPAGRLGGASERDRKAEGVQRGGAERRGGPRRRARRKGGQRAGAAAYLIGQCDAMGGGGPAAIYRVLFSEGEGGRKTGRGDETVLQCHRMGGRRRRRRRRGRACSGCRIAGRRRRAPREANSQAGLFGRKQLSGAHGPQARLRLPARAGVARRDCRQGGGRRAGRTDR